jgi:hypothetical protein
MEVRRLTWSHESGLQGRDRVTVRGQKGKKVGRCVDAAAWLGVRATGVVGACPLEGVALTCACCGGAAARSGD